jgi:Mor family transcriptional regulator
MELPTEAVTDSIPFAEERNKEIYRRYLASERATDLAREFGISLQLIYVLIRKMKRRG